MEPAGDPPQTYKGCKQKNTNSQAYKFCSVNARTLTPHHEQIMVPALYAPDSVVPSLRRSSALLANSRIRMMHEVRNLFLIHGGIVLGFKFLVQRGGIFSCASALCKIHHPFFEVR